MTVNNSGAGMGKQASAVFRQRTSEEKAKRYLRIRDAFRIKEIYEAQLQQIRNEDLKTMQKAVQNRVRQLRKRDNEKLESLLKAFLKNGNVEMAPLFLHFAQHPNMGD